MAPVNPRIRDSRFSHCWLQFQLSLYQQLEMFPFRTPAFSRWITLVDRCSVPHNDVVVPSQGGVSTLDYTLLAETLIICDLTARPRCQGLPSLRSAATGQF
jgi:hypothetical protein